MVTTAILHDVSPEIVFHIVSFLPQPDLKNLRLVGRRLSKYATRQLFRSTCLAARVKDGNNPRRFIQLAYSKHSDLVREARCDFSSIVHDGFVYTESIYFEFLPAFWGALPLLARFRNLCTLHICFDSEEFEGEPDEPTLDLKHSVLVAVFRALAGTWAKDSNESTNKTLSGIANQTTNDQARALSQDTSLSRIPLSTLIVSNLEDYHKPSLTDMPEFKTVISGIKALRLDIAQRQGYIEEFGGVSTAPVNQCKEMFAQLPQTWLSLSIAANLQVLSLYYQSWWGWFPKMDFRLIGGGHGLPRLKSLSLGRFVFSHERDVDWVTSLNLEELYLERCAVLGEYLDYSTTQEGFWTARNGSPATTEFVGEMKATSLRWHAIIFRIRNSMPTLRRFRWCGQPSLRDQQYVFVNYRHYGSGYAGEYEKAYIQSFWDNYVPQLSGQFWNKAFRHSTLLTSPKLSLESDFITEV